MPAARERLYALDTNLYIRAYREPEARAELEAFQQAFAPFCFLPSVVVQELLAGVRGDVARRRLERHLLDPFERRGRTPAPTAGAWKRSGAVLSELREREGLDVGKISKAFANDVLLALTCRESGLVLVTDNVRDFERIRRVVDFEFIPPWPRPRPAPRIPSQRPRARPRPSR